MFSKTFSAQDALGRVGGLLQNKRQRELRQQLLQIQRQSAAVRSQGAAMIAALIGKADAGIVINDAAQRFCVILS